MCLSSADKVTRYLLVVGGIVKMCLSLDGQCYLLLGGGVWFEARIAEMCLSSVDKVTRYLWVVGGIVEMCLSLDGQSCPVLGGGMWGVARIAEMCLSSADKVTRYSCSKECNSSILEVYLPLCSCLFYVDYFWRCTMPPEITDLPDNAVNAILMRLPFQDAVRTSMISKKWRYKWCKLPQLMLDDELWKTTDNLLSPSIKFTTILYNILTLHPGPITNFTLSMSKLKKYPKISNLMHFLYKGIQHALPTSLPGGLKTLIC
ncbi:hypothetical protein CQW23_27470 [Capsicum baccatum]|uniref:F-box domain-containing protein n=1 Tax=Capsicum baccatum TaxID=33114 RepID=A0A2G2VDT4_CAPBA|nr:hypothetical protein CQW23_27470 [Capsicum baccatum]